MGKKFYIDKHVLIPQHSKLSDKEKAELFESYRISARELPKILKSDPAISSFEVKAGDVIKVIRLSPSAGENIYYRVVVSGSQKQ